MELSTAKLLVIGGAGLVGSHIVDQLINEPVSEIIVFDNFVCGTRANLADALKDMRVRTVDASITD
jgi:UDP-glucose 4-epimerase